MLSWPFGIYDNELMDRATRAGDIAAVTLDRRHATAADAIMALPRYLVPAEDNGGATPGAARRPGGRAQRTSTATVKDNAITEYRATVKVAFLVEKK
jgi:hypothetical protein